MENSAKTLKTIISIYTNYDTKGGHKARKTQIGHGRHIFLKMILLDLSNDISLKLILRVHVRRFPCEYFAIIC